MISHRQLFLQHQGQTSDEPLLLEIVKAKGIVLTDYKKKRYLDLISGISVSNLGHGYPSVVREIKKQLNKYMHLMVYGELIQSPQVRLASLLAKQLPKSLQQVYFVNSGSEAIEGALKLAKRYTGRSELISFHHAYHGSSHGALSIMGSETFKNAFRPLLPGTKQIQFNSFDELEIITCRTACVVVEPVQGEAGYIPADKLWLQALRKKCDETKTLLIFDEIQTGYGRTGSLFAFHDYGVIPDVLVVAKGFGGGLPLGAFISSKEIMSCLTHQPVLGHITTFGGHPVSCAASLETLKVLLKEHYIQQVEEKEKLFRTLLNHHEIVKISGTGLMLAVEFSSETFNRKIISRCIENGVLTDWFLFNGNSMRISPPLIISHDQIKRACKIILKSIDEVSKT
jgi:acetylornithine/N-succinyldiaminopimelate aminotransferase